MNTTQQTVQMHQLLTDLNQIGLTVRQHRTDPQPNEWYAGTYGGGDIGPYPTAYAALLAGVGWLLRLLTEVQQDLSHP